MIALRPMLPRLLVLVAVVVAVIGATVMIGSARSGRAAVDLRDIAQAVELPAGSTPFSGVMDGCPMAQYIRCGQVDQDVDAVAQQMQVTLSVIAEEQAKLSCTTLPSRQPGILRNCLVRIDHHGHGVMIDVNPQTRRVDGHVVLAGAMIRITAF